MAFDANSLYSASGRRSTDPFVGGNDFNPPHLPSRPSAGYNRNSFMDAGREEPVKGLAEDIPLNQSQPVPPNWDVYADFNNAGPRYTDTFGMQDSDYQTKTHKDDTNSTTNGPVEMVTVPAFGPEWTKDEMRGMTKAGKREQRNADRGMSGLTAFRRNRKGCCGISWLNRRFLTFFVFFLIVVIGIVLAFTIPRVPGLSFNNDTPLINATDKFGSSIPVQFSRSPANFSFPAYAPVQFNTFSNFITLDITSISGQVYDAQTGRQVGNVTLGDTKIPAKVFQVVNLPVTFSYVASNDSEPTWSNWYKACVNPQNSPNQTRPGLDFRMVVQMTIAGLPGTSSTGTTINGAPCPIVLPASAA